MSTAKIQLKIYQDEDGDAPFLNWLQSLKDPSTRARVQVRRDRAEDGNLGDHKALGGGLWELRLSHGAGIRIYFGREGRQFVVLLVGGDKRSQRRTDRRNSFTCGKTRTVSGSLRESSASTITPLPNEWAGYLGSSSREILRAFRNLVS